MSRMIGTVSRGVRAPIIKSGDDIVKIVTDSVLEASKDAGFEIRNRDIVATRKAESILGWHARYNLDDMCRHADNWQTKNPNGYDE